MFGPVFIINKTIKYMLLSRNACLLLPPAADGGEIVNAVARFCFGGGYVLICLLLPFLLFYFLFFSFINNK